MPKRKFDECASDGAVSGESEDSNCSSEQTDGSTDVVPKPEAGPFNQARKKSKKSVSFDGVTIYYFPRKQGFTCVPSQGGSTLGMSETHHGVEKYSLSEYSVVQRHVHNQYLLDQHQQGKIILPTEKIHHLASSDSSKSDSFVQSPGSDVCDEDPEGYATDDDYYFLQPVPTRQRRVMLRQSGIKKIEPLEKEECKDIRSSREVCGCNCKVFCDPETCICSLAGIKCQVDRLSFPCGCSKDGCANVSGRIEFNPIRVRTHFLHTLMRLEFEKKRIMEAKSGGFKPNRLAAMTAAAIPCQSKQQMSKSTPIGEQLSSHCSDTDDTNCSSEQSICSDENSNSNNSNAANQRLPSPQERRDVTKQPGDSDLMSKYNSNERGSCRDCQKSDISELIMHESHFAAASANELDSCMAGNNRVFQSTEEQQIGLPTVTNAGESLPQLMMFSDDEEAYNAEAASAMFQFPKEESSYSESSDCSSEGTGSVDEQPIYCRYDYDGSYEGCSDSPQTTSENDLCGQPLPHGSQQQPRGCESYSNTHSHHPVTCPSEQKYIRADLSSQANGYKLEPISEILTPLRYPGYPAGPVPISTVASSAWNTEPYCPSQPFTATKTSSSLNKLSDDGVLADNIRSGSTDSMTSDYRGVNSSGNNNAMMNNLPPVTHTRPAHSTEYLYPTSTAPCPVNKPEENNLDKQHTSDLASNGTETSNAESMKSSLSDKLPCSGPARYDTAPDDVYKAVPQQSSSPAHSSSSSSDADVKEQGDNATTPKYHELKSSSKPSSVKSSLAFFSGSPSSESFDLTNHNKSGTTAVPSFHAQNVTQSSTSTASADLFGFPRAQTAQPVVTFDLPTGNDEVETNGIDTNGNETEQAARSSPGPVAEHSAPTQNFGEIIKESIVETVSA